MWFKVTYSNLDGFTEFGKANIQVSFIENDIAPVENTDVPFRISPVFPLDAKAPLPDLNNTNIYFLSFRNAYRVFGRLNVLAPEIKHKVFFNVGLSAVLLVTDKEDEFQLLRTVADQKEFSHEKWTINAGKLIQLTYEVFPNTEVVRDPLNVVDYSILPLSERSIVDEFNVSIRFLLTKSLHHMPLELPKFDRLVAEVNELIEELVYLRKLTGDIPQSLSEYSTEVLKDKKQNTIIRYQNLDRIIQINSSLSYVSTQAFSGATPILERRSLVRRHSLLGIGSAILALNHIARFIEDSFSRIDFESTITDTMAGIGPLEGVSDLPIYNPINWSKASINVLSKRVENNQSYYKLPFFNGRLGFRETEYSIAAAIQSISSGATLEWSLMTLTHEMLHGHVRKIITAIFFGDNLSDENIQRANFYKTFSKRIQGKKADEFLIDSIRSILFTYCCMSQTHGSLTRKPSQDEKKYAFNLPVESSLWNIMEQENRNINEIFVHVLDLHYFYGSRVSAYIPLIWCSWVAIPYLQGDLRQYILRSLLTISSKEAGSAHERFNKSVDRLQELLIKYSTNKLDHPIIKDVLAILADKSKLDNLYFHSFKNSLIIVDMITQIFFSDSVRASIFKDDFASWTSSEEEDNFEDDFNYNLPDGFNDEIIESPIAYMLDRMIRQLNSEKDHEDVERETAIEFMALNSK